MVDGLYSCQNEAFEVNTSGTSMLRLVWAVFLNCFDIPKGEVICGEQLGIMIYRRGVLCPDTPVQDCGMNVKNIWKKPETQNAQKESSMVINNDYGM